MWLPASMIVTKDKVYWSTVHEKHTDQAEEFGLCKKGGRGIAYVEITPSGGDFTRPLEEWVYKLNYKDGRTPRWYDAVECESRVRAVLPEWFAAKVVLPGQVRAEVGGNDVIVACYGKILRAYGSSTIQAYGSSFIRAYGSSTIQAYDSSSIEAYDHSAIWAHDHSSVRAYDHSSVEAHDHSSVRAYGNSSIKAHDDSAIWAYDRATVVEGNGNSTISTDHPLPKLALTGRAVLIDRSGDKVVMRKRRSK